MAAALHANFENYLCIQMRDPLYFIALLPEEEIQNEVTAFKQYCARYFGASHSLTSPPHITLVAPFSWPKTALPELTAALDDFAVEQSPFEVQLRDFGSFPPRVIYVDIVPNPALKTLASDLAGFLETQVGLKRESTHGFNPHMTIAHRDLQREVFPTAWKHFSGLSFQRTFEASGITLLRHEQRRWEIANTYFFS